MAYTLLAVAALRDSHVHPRVQPITHPTMPSAWQIVRRRDIRRLPPLLPAVFTPPRGRKESCNRARRRANERFGERNPLALAQSIDGQAKLVAGVGRTQILRAGPNDRSSHDMSKAAIPAANGVPPNRNIDCSGPTQ